MGEVRKKNKLTKAVLTATAILAGAMLLGGCGTQTLLSSSAAEASDEGEVYFGSPLEASDEEEVYFGSLVEACLAKYPALSENPDCGAIENGWQGVVVSPYADDEAIQALAHALHDIYADKTCGSKHDLYVYCYGRTIFSLKLFQSSEEYTYEAIYDELAEGIRQGRKSSDHRNATLRSTVLGSHGEETEEGEYYYLIDSKDPGRSIETVSKSELSIHESWPITSKENYFYRDRLTDVVYGYRGPGYSVYLDSYSDENKLTEHYFSDNSLLYCELYRSLLFDYKAFEQDAADAELAECDPTSYMRDGSEIDLYFRYRLHRQEEFDPDKAIQCAYEVYCGIKAANEQYDTHVFQSLGIRIDDYVEYGDEYQLIFLSLPFDREYTPEEFREQLLQYLETTVDSEPV